MIIDYSHLPVAQQPLIYRLRKRAEIRRNDNNRVSVKEGKPDKISNLLEEAANKIEQLEEENEALLSVLTILDENETTLYAEINYLKGQVNDSDN